MTVSSRRYAGAAAHLRESRRGRSPPGRNEGQKKAPTCRDNPLVETFCCGPVGHFFVLPVRGFASPAVFPLLSLNTISIPHPYDNVKSGRFAIVLALCYTCG